MNSALKYIISLSVLIISLIVLVGVVSLFIVEAKEMNESGQRVEELKRKINQLNRQSPIPSKENYERISADAKIINHKTRELQQFIGKPYKDAVDVLLKELGITRDEFFPMWRKTYENEVKKGSPRVIILKRFFAKFDQKKVKKAIAAFSEKVKESSVEPLNEANIDDCIMEALGIPRKIIPLQTKRYMMEMQENLIAYMQKGKCQNCGFIVKNYYDPECDKCGERRLDFFVFGKGGNDDVVKQLTFEKFKKDELPRSDEVSYIFKHFKIIEDLLFRIKATGIKELNSISRESLKGQTIGDYMFFTYTIEVKGSQNAIIQLIKNLQKGYRDNRVYVIKSVKLESEKDAVKEIMATKRTVSARVKKGKKEVEEIATGIPLIGNNDSIKAKIVFQYFIYIGDDLTEND